MDQSLIGDEDLIVWISVIVAFTAVEEGWTLGVVVVGATRRERRRDWSSKRILDDDHVHEPCFRPLLEVVRVGVKMRW